ncbi:hypothetical protein AB0B94_31095 [Micromonospora sp. NPDC048986]|uniref:hypothetical protein n=1 Tax=Micromonospora sp. NPDC048986 TaxID=3155644 RepID=UPI00340E440B
MGHRTAEARIYADVSANNDERDKQDRAAWAAFLVAVQEIANRDEYAELGIQVSDYGTY